MNIHILINDGSYGTQEAYSAFMPAYCRQARDLESVEGIEISNVTELAKWTVEADKVFTFY